MKTFIRTLIISTAIAAITTSAYALSLQEGRATGQIGEGNKGYAVALKPSPDVNAAVAEINGKRKQEYARISQQNGQPVDTVAALAAGQIAGQLESGAMYQDASGNWKKK